VVVVVIHGNRRNSRRHQVLVGVRKKMATIRERVDATGKKSYQVQVRIKGFPPQTNSFPTKTLAKQWAAQVETDLRAGRYMPRAEAQRHTVKELLEEYRKKVLIPLKPKEVRTQGPQIDWWIKKLGAYSLADLTPAAIGKCRDELSQTPLPSRKGKKRKAASDANVNAEQSDELTLDDDEKRARAPATVVRYMAVLSQAFNYAVKEWQWMPESPMSKVKRPKVNNSKLRFLSDEEHARLLSAAKASANRYLHTIVITALSTGMRYGEIMNLRWSNVILDDADDLGLILLGTTKNGEPRGVPLVKNACVAIKAMRQQHAAKNDGKVKADFLLFPSEDDADKPVEIRKAWETALRRAEIDDFRFHDLRHTTASYLAMDGATAPEIAEILGHKSLQMVKRYSHFNKAHIAKVMARMNQSRLGGSTDVVAQKSVSNADADNTEK
jgi:integrase